MFDFELNEHDQFKEDWFDMLESMDVIDLTDFIEVIIL